MCCTGVGQLQRDLREFYEESDLTLKQISGNFVDQRKDYIGFWVPTHAYPRPEGGGVPVRTGRGGGTKGRTNWYIMAHKRIWP